MAALGHGSQIEMVQDGISQRQAELQRVADVLAREAQRFKRISGWVRVLLIVCGALAASQSVFEQAFAGYKEYAFLAFAFLGVSITTLAGLEAAFKFEGKGAELALLAAGCHSTVRKTDATWYREVGLEMDEKEKIAGAMELIELQDSRLSEIQEKAAASGLNIALEVRRDYRWSGPRNDLPYAKSEEGNGPYAA